MEHIQNHKPVEIRGKTFYLLQSPKVLKEISLQINKYWNVNDDQILKFHGPQPASLERRNYTLLIQRDYFVCVKFDGLRFFLFLTKVFDTCINVMIDRKFNCYLVDQNFPEICYERQTLLDGEFMGNQFIIHDCFCICGFSLMKETFNTRIKACKDLISKHYIVHSIKPKNTFTVLIKQFYPKNQIRQAFEEYERLKYQTDGLIFIPDLDPVGKCTQLSLFKWKPKSSHTLDFKVIIQSDVNEVQLITRSRNTDTIFTSFPPNELPIDIEIHSGDIVEFRVDYDTDKKKRKFIPICVRKDKPFGNNLYTIRKTLLNIEENITKEELIDLLSYRN